MRLVPRQYTYPPTDDETRSIRYITWMKAEREKIARRQWSTADGRENHASAAHGARQPGGD